jgi:hypothetical protein
MLSFVADRFENGIKSKDKNSILFNLISNILHNLIQNFNLGIRKKVLLK